MIASSYRVISACTVRIMRLINGKLRKVDLASSYSAVELGRIRDDQRINGKLHSDGDARFRCVDYRGR